ncbi:hypothetical protein, partial [Rhizobium changzhiense]|uniref:hypothetical protein n=1 Tax=Rhizobium changzhiense TaxID=2692317 RepID=UPI0019D5EDCA
HPMLASTPASILNHKTAKNGIPSDSTKSGYALSADAKHEAGSRLLVIRCSGRNGARFALHHSRVESHKNYWLQRLFVALDFPFPSARATTR